MTEDVAAVSAAEAAAPPGPALRSGLLASRPWAAVVLLMLLTVLNYLDRTLPAVLAEPLKHELGLSDTFLGMLNGLGFVLLYAVAGLFIARIADRGRYGAVITVSLGLWSVMTGLGGLAATGVQLGLTRLGVALGEAGATPASHAYISRNFAPAQRAAALAVLTLGAPFGGMAGLVVGGVVGEWLGWRQTFVVMGAVGLVLTPILFLALGPGRPLPAVDAAQQPSVLAQLRKRSVIWILLAVAFISMGGYSLSAFTPAFLVRVHGMTLGHAGLQLGLLSGLVGTTSLLGMGWLVSGLAKRDARWTLRVPMLMVFACLPFGFAGYLVADPGLAILCIGIGGYTTITSYLALTVAALHSLVPAAMRARISAIMLFGSALFGGVGPLIAGMVSDALHPTLGAAALGRALLIVPIAYGLGGLCYMAALKTFRADMVTEA